MPGPSYETDIMVSPGVGNRCIWEMGGWTHILGGQAARWGLSVGLGQLNCGHCSLSPQHRVGGTPKAWPLLGEDVPSAKPVPTGLVGRHGVTAKPHRGLISSCTMDHCGGGGARHPGTADPLCPLSSGVCDRAPDFLSPSEDQVLRPALGSSVALNCTAWVVSGPHCSLPSVQWLKDGLPLGNGGHYSLHEHSW